MATRVCACGDQPAGAVFLGCSPSGSCSGCWGYWQNLLSFCAFVCCSLQSHTSVARKSVIKKLENSENLQLQRFKKLLWDKCLSLPNEEIPPSDLVLTLPPVKMWTIVNELVLSHCCIKGRVYS